MPLEKLSNAIAKLYACSIELDPEHFPQSALEVMRELVAFDGGIFGKSSRDAETSRCQPMLVDEAYVYQRSTALLDEYLDIVGSDPRAALHVRDNPAVIDCARDFGDGARPLGELARRHSIRHLLLLSEPGAQSVTIWLALFRADDMPFSPLEQRMLKGAWTHLLQACRVNLQQALRAVDPYSSTRPLALVNRRGLVEAATPAMSELIRFEWPDYDGRRLAQPVLHTLIEHGRFRGSRIELTASPRHGYLACLARRTPVLDVLSPAERAVAEQFARGLGHKEIASQLRVSPNTVRNQLAHVYQKLGIHSKAELSRTLSSRQAR